MDDSQDNFYFASSEEAESAFYSAFEMADISLMEAVIADDNVSCIHPNAMPIIGRQAVMDSWKKILEMLSEGAFYPEVLHRSVEGDEIGNTATHIVAERIAADHKIDAETNLLLTTNVYVRQSNGWRMRVHHSSLPPYQENQAIENDPSITHNVPPTLQ